MYIYPKMSLRMCRMGEGDDRVKMFLNKSKFFAYFSFIFFYCDTFNRKFTIYPQKM